MSPLTSQLQHALTDVTKHLATLASSPEGAAAAAEHQELLQQLQQAVAEAAEAAATACAPFAWTDGPLVTAMREGAMILVDEINLAEDAVLERLNRWVGLSCVILDFLQHVGYIL